MPLEEATWCTTSPDDLVYSVTVQGVQVTRASREKGFKVLGAQVSFNNAFDIELCERARKAWRAFFKYKEILMCKRAPIAQRLRSLQVLVESSLFYCAGSWNLKGTQCAKLRGIQQDMIRKMLRIKRYATEDLTSYCVSCARAVKFAMGAHNVEKWDAYDHRLVFKWAGHVYRMNTYGPSRITIQVSHFKDRHWIQTIAEQNSGNQLHCRRLRIWRWERPLYIVFAGRSSTWHEAAKDKTAWLSLLDEMVMWRSTHR